MAEKSQSFHFVDVKLIWSKTILKLFDRTVGKKRPVLYNDFNRHQDSPTLYMSTITKCVYSERKIDTILHQQYAHNSLRAIFWLLTSFKPDLRY